MVIGTTTRDLSSLLRRINDKCIDSICLGGVKMAIILSQSALVRKVPGV